MPEFSTWHSLRARATIFTLAIFVLGIWSLSFYVSRGLQADMEELLGEQQFSVVTAVAKQVNDNLTERLQALETVAKEMDAGLIGRPAVLQARLEQRPLLQLLFNGGCFVTRLDATAIADVPLSAQRIGVNYSDRDYMIAALKEGKSSIGRPVMGKQARAPIFAMSVPVHDVQGKVIGVLVGVTNLGKPNFLDMLTNSQYGKTGGYLLIHAPSRQIITATDKKRVMEMLPAAGVNRYVDRNIAGYEGYSVLVNALGEEQLASVKQIPAVDWYVLLGTPTAEAFAPLQHRQQRLLWASALMTMLIGALTYWTLRRQFAPLVATADAMANLAEAAQIPPPLAVTHRGEIGHLVTSFNRILQNWTLREAALQKSEQNLAITLNSIGDAVIATDTAGRVTGMNPTAERLTGWPLAEARGRMLVEVFRIVNANTRQPALNPLQLVLEHGEVMGMANHTTLLARDGREYQIADSAAPIRNSSSEIVGVVLVFSDVSEKYQIELALKNSEHQYRSLLENLLSGVVVHSPDTSIMLANAMAASLLGLTQEQLLGKEAPDPDWSFLRDDGTPMPLEDYPVNLVLNSGAPLKNYVAGVRHPGPTEPTWVICNGYPIRDDDGKLLQVVVTFTDITQRKQAELALQHHRVMMERTENLAHMASFEWEVDTNIVTWSPEMFRIFGRDPALGVPNLEGQSELYTPESAQMLFDAVGKAVSDGTPYTLELMTVQPGGEQRPCFAMGFPERDASGRVVRLAGLVQDISERKRAENALLSSEERWKFAIEGAGDGLWDWNIQTGKAFYSPRYKAMLGFAEDEISDAADEWSSRIHPDDAPGVFAALQPYMDGKPGSAAVEFRMLCKDGNWLWTMGRGMVVERDAQGRPLRMIGTNTDITERKEHEGQLEHIAHFDALTNLPNRVLLADRLHQAMAQEQRRGQQLAVAYLDLDGFKVINDQHGHESGDQILITLAKRMKEVLREGDTLARIGGDEFVVVLIDLEGPSASVPLLNRLLVAAALPVQVGNLTLQVSASLGVTFYPQAQDIDADQLLRQADQAMYQAKVAGKNSYQIFDAALDSSMRAQHESLERIRLALERREFVLHYQPKVDMHRGQVIGAEALIRWQHPEKGLLAPATFLPVIENHPLAVEMGEWVIDTALTQMEAWHAVGLDLPSSVNIGARQLQQAGFVQRLQAILKKHPQVHSGCIELEVLETSALADMAQAAQVIEECAQIGVRFALDDFGTGYSSLTYLKRLHVAQLKIDQSFVRNMLDDPDDLAILQGVIGLAAAFKCQVIAEGVETVAHGTALLKLGCQLAQGNGIAWPMPAAQMPAWVATWQPDAAWYSTP